MQGTTSFAAISPQPGDIPFGYSFCPTCEAYDITTTAAYTPPVEVCLPVPAEFTNQQFLNLRLLRGENGVYVDRTTRRFTDASGVRYGKAWQCTA